MSSSSFAKAAFVSANGESRIAANVSGISCLGRTACVRLIFLRRNIVFSGWDAVIYGDIEPVYGVCVALCVLLCADHSV